MKKSQRLRLTTETLTRLNAEKTEVAGAYPHTVLQSCQCDQSVVSHCVCSYLVGQCW